MNEINSSKTEDSASTINFFVVEDHTLTNRGIRELLSERSNYLCAGFSFSKDESLAKLRELSEQEKLPDILILDLFLGNDNGLEAMIKQIIEDYEEDEE